MSSHRLMLSASPQQLATLSVPGQPEVELSRQPSGSGFSFAAPGLVVMVPPSDR